MIHSLFNPEKRKFHILQPVEYVTLLPGMARGRLPGIPVNLAFTLDRNVPDGMIRKAFYLLVFVLLPGPHPCQFFFREIVIFLWHLFDDLVKKICFNSPPILVTVEPETNVKPQNLPKEAREL